MERFVIEITAALWARLGGGASALDTLTFDGPSRVLPSVYDVTGFAAATTAVATLAVAELLAARRGDGLPAVTVNTRAASAAFLCEQLFAPEGWERPALWDPIAGDYAAADGWIRLHTNYAHPRDGVLQALGVTEVSREAVAAAAARWPADLLETRVVQLGGCAAAQHSRKQWSASDQGAAVDDEPPIGLAAAPGALLLPRLAEGDQPLSGVKVLDLTRVIAGPVCTRFLAAHGASVLRIDPPGFEEVPALVPETSAGKRCAFVDLATADGRALFDHLLAEAHVVVHGLRPGALADLCYSLSRLRRVNPNLVVASHNAYGWSGPWAQRRGFDSLVQMSCGIAAAGAEAKAQDRPFPLPAQALDHGTGLLLAAGVCRALAEQRPADVRGSLIGAANFLMGLPLTDGLEIEAPTWTEADTEPRTTAWGPARAVPIPGRVAGAPARFSQEPGPLGRHEPRFA
ncbi:MAG: CoA transferase, family protein, partial [Acidimicrobiia bacterium]|nr:CoA transferase, family protein [Acidimicrobiia bacterium]